MKVLAWTACALALAACAREGPPPAGTAGAGQAPAVSPVPGDTLRGTLRRVGSEPAVSYLLVDAAGRAAALSGEGALLERLTGLEVMVAGAPGPEGFRVESVAVRAANGVPAVDGVLAREGGRDVLVLADGRRAAIVRLPEALRGRTGARVWLAGPLDGDIDSFGILAEPR